MAYAVRSRTTFTLLVSLLGAVCLLVDGCRARKADPPASISFSTIPTASEGGSERLDAIAGRVTGGKPGQRIVLFARAGVWWVQPFENQPFTLVQEDSTWHAVTHLGSHYAALLVDDGYQPPATTETLPEPGGRVIAVATVEGKGLLPERKEKLLQFSGYTWVARQLPSNRGGDNDYSADNAWVDDQGLLHLRITKRDGHWQSAEVKLTRSLGYGTYAFSVRDITQMDPAATFGMFTWDDLGADQNHRGIDIEISRWGVAANKNAQFLIQPYYVPANVFRFESPAGRVTYAFRWQPGHVSFNAMRTPSGTRGAASATPFASHDFAAGVPVPGGETPRINLYVFRDAPVPVQREVEVVIEKFEYLP
jgi:hypothetical protein